MPHARALVRGLRKEEQDLLHRLVLPPGSNGCRRAVQHRDLASAFLGLGFAGDLVEIAVKLVLAKVLCVHSLLEHTDVTIMYDNEALYDICRRILVFRSRQFTCFPIARQLQDLGSSVPMQPPHPRNRLRLHPFQGGRRKFVHQVVECRDIVRLSFRCGRVSGTWTLSVPPTPT